MTRTGAIIALAFSAAATTAHGKPAKPPPLPASPMDPRFDVRAFEQETCGDDPWCHLGFRGAFAQPAFDRAFREAREGPLHDEDE